MSGIRQLLLGLRCSSKMRLELESASKRAEDMHKHSLFSPTFFLCSIFLASSLFVFPSPVRAGFQWVSPPPDSGAQMQTVTPAPTPAPVAPVIIQAPTRQQKMQAPQKVSPAVSSEIPAETNAATEHVLSLPGEALSSSASLAQEKAVKGFADNVPLAVALRQILPPEIGFSVSQDVSLGTLVSWKGGSPWRETLRSMLQSVGLTIQEQGQMVRISRNRDGASAPASTTPTLQPPADNKPLALLPSAGADSAALQTPISVPEVTPAGSQAMVAPQGQSNMVDTWTANRGDTLRKVLEDWCRRSGVELSWQAEYDYPLQASVTLTGTFEDAVRNLLIGFQEAQPQPMASLFNNASAGQTALVVQVRGNNYSE